MSNESCKLCGGHGLVAYLNSDKINLCLACGGAFLVSDIIPRDLDNYYQGNIFYAENSKNPVLIEGMKNSARFYLNFLKKHIRPSDEKVFIDIGSNYGSLVEEACKCNFKAKGLEKNDYLVSASLARGLDVSSQDLAICVSDNSVDVITMMHVLEHLPDPLKSLKDIHQKLKTDGLLMIGVPNFSSYLSKKDGLSWRYIALEHLFYFSPKSLMKMLNLCGFDVVALKRESTNLSSLSIRQLGHYLFGQPLARDRFKPKDRQGRKGEAVSKKSFIRSLVKTFLIFVIKILGREDFIVVLARKK